MELRTSDWAVVSDWQALREHHCQGLTAHTANWGPMGHILLRHFLLSRSNVFKRKILNVMPILKIREAAQKNAKVFSACLGKLEDLAMEIHPLCSATPI